MYVDLEDGQCRECSGQLEIIDFDDVTLTVYCHECGADYDVEGDAFGDGCVKYLLPLMAEREGLGPDDFLCIGG